MLAAAVCRRFFHCTSSNLQICRMAAYPDAYFRHKEGCETFNYCFFLEKEELRVSRNFNFSRKVTETIGEFQNRILTNVEKTLSKKRKKKSKDDEADSGADEGIKVVFRSDGEEVDSSKNCKEILSSSNITMNVLGIDFKVLVNRPVITAIALPESMLADFPISPSKLDVEFGDRRNCQLTWYLSCNELVNDTNINKEALAYKEVAQGASFTPTSDDVNHVVKLKCEPLNGQLKGPSVEVLSKNKIEASPGHCPFDTRHKFTSEFLSGARLFITSPSIFFKY